MNNGHFDHILEKDVDSYHHLNNYISTTSKYGSGHRGGGK
jgi:hypothetical protein